jgi:ABC-type enterobactin transport system permease subunit
VFRSLVGGGDGGLSADIIWRLRFPRVVLAVLLGAALSLGGMVFQALLEEVYGCTLLVDESPLGKYPRVHLVPKRYLGIR